MEKINFRNILIIILFLVLLYKIYNNFYFKNIQPIETFYNTCNNRQLNKNNEYQQAENDEMRILNARKNNANKMDKLLINEAKNNELLNNQIQKDYKTHFNINGNPKKIIMYNFNTKWCGHSRNFQTIWDAFSSSLTDSDNIQAIDVKCDDDANKELCAKFNIKGYPSVIISKDSKFFEYNGQRSVDSLRKEVNLLPLSNTMKKPNVNNNKTTIYNFNTKWCGHSKNFQSTWDNFAKGVNMLDNIQAIDIKCDDDKNHEICKNFNIEGYPSVIIENSDGIVNYNGGRTIDELRKAVKLGKINGIESSNESHENNYTSKTIIYNFNTEWCGYSKKFQPIWNTFANSINDHDNISVIDVKCDNDANKELCEKYKVEGYPTILIVKGKKVDNYKGARTVEGLRSALNLK